MAGNYDSFHRSINYLRISVTDRCNFRCTYCSPTYGDSPISHQSILTYEEICIIVEAAVQLGIRKIRITGGEPLLRARLDQLIQLLSSIEEIDDLSLTTNGSLLSLYVHDLKKAGLHRINVSLDTLIEDKFRQITHHNSLGDVLEGIEVSKSVGLNPVKINMVVMLDVNDDELLHFASKTIHNAWHVRFIEMMPTSAGKLANLKFMPASEIKKRLEPLGELEPCRAGVGNGPAKYFRFPGASGTIGFIAPVSETFCLRCNRLRLTSEGMLRPCLFDDNEINLKQPLRTGASSEILKCLIQEAITLKPFRHNLAKDYTPCGRAFCQIGG